MKSGFDFATSGWIMIICGALMMVAAPGVYWFSRRTPALPLARNSLWPNVAFGIGSICHGIALRAKTSWNDPESTLDWIGVAFILLASAMWIVVLMRHWRARLR